MKGRIERKRRNEVSRRNKIKTEESNRRKIIVAHYITKLVLYRIIYPWEWKQENNYLSEAKRGDKK